jgi:phosphatidylinositol-3-phosphatase
MNRARRLEGRMGRGWRRRGALLAGLALLALAGCGGGQGPATTPTSLPATTAAPGTSAPGRTAPATRGPRRIVVVVEENHSYDQVIGSPEAPFLNRLAGQGTLLTRFYATTHPSLPNYIAMVSGGTQGITSDCGDCNVDTPNLADQLERAGISWKAYQQGLPAPCSDAHVAGDYAKKHDPFMYFHSVRADPARCAKVVPFDRLDADLAAGHLPRFVFVTPDLAHDMHGTGEGAGKASLVRAADDWLRTLYGRLAASTAWREDTRLVVTWDEGGGGGGGGRGACCGGLGAGGHIATVVAGPRVRPGRDATTYDHYALLRSVEAAFGLPFLGHAADPTSATIPAVAGPAA